MAFNQDILVSGFEQVFDDQKRTVTLYRATRGESNITGTEELTYDDGASVDVVFFKTGKDFTWDMEGLFEVGDFLVFDKSGNLSIEKDDKITVSEDTFIVQKMHTWRSRGTGIYEVGTGAKLS